MDCKATQLEASRDGTAAVTLAATIERRCASHPHKLAMNFLHEGELDNQEPITYAQLDELARGILSELRTRCREGDRVLLVLPPGNLFVASFLACLYGGFIAVPVAVPGTRANDWERLGAIVTDSMAAVALSSGVHFRKLDKQLKQHVASDCAIQAIDASTFRSSRAADVLVSNVRGDDLAFLQYTSGSTGSPKGVMVSHASLMHNQRILQSAFQHDSSARLVTWLPMFHDMGLIGCTLHALFLGAELHYMAPTSFLQRPMRWLRAVSEFRGTMSGGPNFAYDLCVARYSEADGRQLDLTSWQSAFNGAEPVRAETLDRFYAKFAQHGLPVSGLYPVYGLAEAVLMVSGRPDRERPATMRVSTADYARGMIVPARANDEARVLVGVGHILGDQHAVIVDPERRTRAKDKHIGEIWLSGPSVGNGYWRKQELSEQTFGAKLAGHDDGRPYLRTGDLGYVAEDGELYITGRLKDVIIIHGSNYFPQDIEYVVEEVGDALRAGGGAVFSVEHEGAERVVVLQEVRDERDERDWKAVIRAIRAKVASEFHLNVVDVCLLRPRALLKTTSGKVQRQRNKLAYLESTLQVVARHLEAVPHVDQQSPVTGGQVFEHLAAFFSANGSKPAKLQEGALFADLDVDSARAAELVEYLSERLGRRIDVGLLWAHQEVSRFCEVLSAQLTASETPAAQSRVPTEKPTNIHEMDDEAFKALLAKELG